MKRTTLLIVILTLFGSSPLWSQDSDLSLQEYAHGTPIPEGQFNPLVPDVYSMTRYKGGSADLYTGSASYSIDIYNYTDRYFNIPVKIAYCGNGYKPNQPSGVVGLGWNLNAGGIITREIRGIPDEATDRVYANKNSGDGKIDDVFRIASRAGLGHNTLKHMISAYYNETNINIFGFGARTVSSKALKAMDFAYSGEIGREFILFQEEIANHESTKKFEVESDLYHFDFMGIKGTFILGDGPECIVINSNSPVGELRIIYNYNVASPLLSSFKITMGDGKTYTFKDIDTHTSSSDWGYQGYSPESENSISCWKLTKIETQNGMTAEFEYGPEFSTEIENKAICVDALTVSEASGERHESWHGCGMYKEGTVKNTLYQSNISKITIPDRATIHFTYDDNKLISIIVNNVNNRQVRSCSLSYKQFGPQCLLKKIWLSSEGEYTFQYYGEDSTASLPDSPTCLDDWYGYYSDDITIPTYKSGSLKTYSTKLLDSKSKFNFNDTRILMLKCMIYPTGGYSVYNYEQNRYLRKFKNTLLDEEQTTGGIRVYRIDTYSSDNVLKHSKKYRYVTAEGRCSGILNIEPHIYFHYKLESPTLFIEREVVSSMFISSQPRNYHIGYTRVLEETYSAADSVACSTVEYDFCPLSDGPYEESFNSSTSDFISQDGQTFTYHDLGSDYVSAQEINGSLVEGKENRRTIYDGPQSLNLIIAKTEFTTAFWQQDNKDIRITLPSIFHGKIYDRTLYRGVPYVKTASKTEYGTNNNPIRTTLTEISSFTQCGRACKTTSLDSRGRCITTELKFRTDYPSYIREKTISVDSMTIVAERYNYDYFNCNLTNKTALYPSSIMMGRISPDGHIEDYERVLSVDSYDDYGNPEKVRDATENTIEYKWGYFGLHLIKKTILLDGYRLCWFWTWNPLIGMTSHIKPNLFETKYGIDQYGRLTSIIESGNVIEKYEYNIKNF